MGGERGVGGGQRGKERVEVGGGGRPEGRAGEEQGDRVQDQTKGVRGIEKGGGRQRIQRKDRGGERSSRSDQLLDY